MNITKSTAKIKATLNSNGLLLSSSSVSAGWSSGRFCREWINQIAHRVNSNPEKLELYSDDLIFIKSQIKKIKMDNEELIKKVFKSFKIK
mgnify:CR=1 FL=1